ncbi:MAG: porin [Planctomycetota bacterium]
MMARCVFAAVMVFLIGVGTACGQDKDADRMEKIEKQIESLTRELESMKSQGTIDKRIDELRERLLFDEAQMRKSGSNIGYKDGFYVRTDDEKFEIKLGGRVMADWWMYEGGIVEPVATAYTWPAVQPHVPGAGEMTDTFFIRRAYLDVSGHMWGKAHPFKIQMDFAAPTTELKEAYMGLEYVPWMKFRMGMFKPPIGREHLQSSRFITLVERSLINDLLCQEYDSGVMVHGDLFDGMLNYATGVFNGTYTTSWQRNVNDNNDAKDWVYRLVAKPFKDSKNQWLEGFEIGHDLMIGEQPAGGGIRGRTAGDIDYYPSNVAFPGAAVTGVGTQMRQWNPSSASWWGPTAGAQVHGERRIVGVDAAWYVGPFALVGEYMNAREHRDDLPIAGATSRYVSPRAFSLAPIEHSGWYVTASYVLTGEKKTDKGVTPNKDFEPMKGGWGAWEIAMRIEGIEHQSMDPILVYNYRNDFGARRTEPIYHLQDNAFTLGVNWYLNRNVAVKWNWVHDSFDEKLMAEDCDTDTFMTRFQIWW